MIRFYIDVLDVDIEKMVDQSGIGTAQGVISNDSNSRTGLRARGTD